MLPKSDVSVRTGCSRAAKIAAYWLCVCVLVLGENGALGNERIVGLLSGRACNDKPVEREITRRLRRAGSTFVAPQETSQAIGGVRAERALVRARRLYLSTDFSGCAALLVIVGQEQARQMFPAAHGDFESAQRTLANVNWWLGVCSQLAGDNALAQIGYERSFRLGGVEVNIEEFPPEVAAAYRAVSARLPKVVACKLPNVSSVYGVWIDGKRLQPERGTLRVAEGSHHIHLVRGFMNNGDVGVTGLRRKHVTRASGWYRVTPKDCVLRATPIEFSQNWGCVSDAEAAEAMFVGDVVRKAGAAGAFVVQRDAKSFHLRSMTGSKDMFTREVSGVCSGSEGDRSTILDLAGVLIQSHRRVEMTHKAPRPWYGSWWFWVVTGAVAGVSAATTAALVH